MSKYTALDLNRLYAAYAADPAGQANPLGFALLDRVTRCLYNMPESFKDDLVQNCLLAIWAKLDTVQLKKTFSKWVGGVVYNMRAECFRVNKYQCEEIAFSQLGTEDENGDFVEFDPSTAIDGHDPLSDLQQPKGDREDSATAKLDVMRASFKRQRDRDLFDQLRAGRSLTEAAAAMGQSYGAVQRRFARWKERPAEKLSDVLHFPYVDSRGGVSLLAA